jgi:Stage II sporulation protein E (SpoIIE)
MERRGEFAAASLQTESYLEREHNVRPAVHGVALVSSKRRALGLVQEFISGKALDEYALKDSISIEEYAKILNRFAEQKLDCCCAIMSKLSWSISENPNRTREFTEPFARIWKEQRTFTRRFSLGRVCRFRVYRARPFINLLTRSVAINYDFLPLLEGRWSIAIGDVSGKGIGAALIMASLQASLRAQALDPHLDLSALVGDVNRLVFESSPTHFFASLFYAECEPATRVLKYVNAGHNPPIVVRMSNGSSKLFHMTPSHESLQFRQFRDQRLPHPIQLWANHAGKIHGRVVRCFADSAPLRQQ